MFYDNEIIFLAVELKYCERCGSLYVRRSDSETKLCLPCIDAEQTVENFFLAKSMNLRGSGWAGSVGAMLAGVRHSSGSIDADGGTA